MPDSDTITRMKNPINKSQLRDIHRIISRCEANAGTIVHDLNDAGEVSFLRDCAIRAGKTPERYPALFGALTAGGPRADTAALPNAAGDYVEGGWIEFVGTLKETGNVAASAFYTTVGDIDAIQLYLHAIDKQTGAVLASGSQTQYIKKLVQVKTDDSTAQPPTKDMQMLLSWIYWPKGSQSPIRGSMVKPWSRYAEADPVVDQPKQRPDRKTGDLKDIVIGLARGISSKDDVDYWFWQDKYDESRLAVPLVGNVRFQYPIATPLVPNNLDVKCCLARKEGGKCEIAPTSPEMQRVLAAFSVDQQDKQTLRWSLPAGPTSAESKAILFGVSPWVSDTKTYFSAIVTVLVRKGSDFDLAAASIASSDTPDQNPFDGIAFIKPIVYVWHCLAAGTMISMADGSARAVETLKDGDMVRSGDGGAARVRATFAQPHSGLVYKVVLANGASLLCSGTHPVRKVDRLIQVASVKVGDPLVTPSGPVPVQYIATEDYNGGMFNLEIDNDSDGNTFIANGLVAGDHRAQVVLLNLKEDLPSYVREQLPPHLHTDFDSTMADRSART
jgi:hypothetical protein